MTRSGSGAKSTAVGTGTEDVEVEGHEDAEDAGRDGSAAGFEAGGESARMVRVSSIGLADGKREMSLSTRAVPLRASMCQT